MAIEHLIELAVKARDKAYAPYSNHPVGAAILANDGNCYVGCNVENAAYPLGTCAEQSAISAMLMGGGKTIQSIVVVGPNEDYCSPCGGCRQRIREFATRDTVLHGCNEHGVILTLTMEELLPMSFGPENVMNVLK